MSSKRILTRRSNGRFRRATLKNTFGLRAYICENCRSINSVSTGQPKPEPCHKCGHGVLS